MKNSETGGFDEQAGRRNIAAAITAMLERHGIAQRDQLRAIETITGIAYDSVRRRMAGINPWTPGELVDLAEHFGESALALYGHALLTGRSCRAMVEQSGLSAPCTVWPGARFDRHKMPAQWVAVEPQGSHDYWRVMPSGDAGDKPCCVVECLIVGGTLRKVRVAILDSDEGWITTAIEFLRDRGIQGVGFATLESFVAALKRDSSGFDGFVLDWRLVRGEPGNVVQKVRRNSETAAVILRIDEVELGSADERALGSALSSARGLMFERSASLLALLHALKLGFASGERRSKVAADGLPQEGAEAA